MRNRLSLSKSKVVHRDVRKDSRPKERSLAKAKRRQTKSPDLRQSGGFTGVASNKFWLIFIVLLINVLGSLMVLSASSIESILQYGSPWSVFEHQLMWLVIGGIGFIIASRVDYHIWKRISPVLLIISGILLMAVLVPGIGLNALGSSRWVGAGPIKLQPSELAKLALVIFGADLLSRRQDFIDDWRRSIRPLVLIFGAFAALVMLQPDMGTTMVIFLTMVSLLFIAGAQKKHLGTLSIVLLMGGVIYGILEPYRRERLTSFLHPFAQSATGGYQVVQSLSALGSGHIMGVGLGASKAKWGFLPNSYTDFIFSIIGEELGLIGTLFVILLFVGLAVICIRIAMNSPDKFGKLLAGGITAWIMIQAIINIGAVTDVLPVTGIPLPFISYGGSSLVLALVSMGILSSISTETSRAGPKLSLIHPVQAPRHVKRAQANKDHFRNFRNKTR